MKNESEPRTGRSAAFILAATVAAAFALRVIPAYASVFAHGTVNFQEGDAWFHMRTVHNLLAHFPLRSGFDPYALFPRGQNIPTGPIWDYLLATVAWILGLGSPSAALIDRVGAWMPAVLGAAFPIPAYALARRQFGSAAAGFAALWMALASGGFLWLTHLGLADHHAAEGLFAFLTLCFVATALDTGKMRFAWLAGLAMGLYLATRPAGIFIPAMLACLILVESKAAAIVLRATAIAALIFLSAAGILWSNYTWLALSLTGGLAAATMALNVLARRGNWPSFARKAIPWLVLVAALVISAVFVPSQWILLAGQIRRVAGSAPGSHVVAAVQELQPVYRAGVVPGWTSVFGALGVVWIPAFGGIALLLSRKPRGSARLLIIWTLVVAVAAVMQVRMVVYLIPVAAVLAGAASAWLTGFGSPLQRRVLSAAMVVAVAAATLVFAVGDVRNNRSPDADLRAAFDWLRSNTPEPEQDPGMWTGYYPQRAYQPGPHDIPFPSAQWGVAVPWDFGYEIEQIARRIPMANGTQSGSNEMASFYTDTLPEEAIGQLRQSGARYVLVDPEAPLFVGFNQSRFLSQLETLQRSSSDYVKVFLRPVPGGFKATPVYLQAYYQSMASRLFVGDGLAETGTGPWVFEIGKVASGDGRTGEVIDSSHRFATAREAADYVADRRERKTIIGCLDPGVSCFDIPAVSGLRLVFTSDPLPISKEKTVHAVKIFEVLPSGIASPTR